ncbi:MAG: gephyrin-like molybdotransferase Glp [Pseudomonadota bacterium]
MLSVAEARARILADVVPVGETDVVPLEDAVSRVLASDLTARHDQPPFAASAMDGYAVRATDIAAGLTRFEVMGEAAAGHGFQDDIAQGQTVRIFTGAPLPPGADAIVIQENVRREGNHINVVDGQPDPSHVRPKAGDFQQGAAVISANRLLTTRDVTLAASMGHAALTVRRKPVVTILATGDELVMPGEMPSPDQIVCSNSFGIAAMVSGFGGAARNLGIAKDTETDLRAHMEQARDADVLITIGGASVGDHDLVADVLQAHGMALDFWKIAMRPGKPLMFGRIGPTRMIGVPGNPVSTLICARLFAIPLLQRLLGLEGDAPSTRPVRLACDLSANGPRAHYMRGILHETSAGLEVVSPSASQDSSLMGILAGADVLIVRDPHAPAAPAGTDVPVMDLDF